MIGFGQQPDLETLSEVLDTSQLEVWDYVGALVIFVAALVLGRLVRALVKRVIAQTRADDFLGDLIGRFFGYVVVAYGFVYSLDSLGVAVTPVLGALGIVGFALAFALQDILANFVAGVLLQLRRPFTAGDEVIVFDHEGRVLEIDGRTVLLRTNDGETVRLPSAEVIKNPIVNHTSVGRRRSDVTVGVGYDTDLDVATDVVIAAIRTIGSVLQSPSPQVLVESFGDSSINLEIRFWHEPSIAQSWRARDRVAREVLVAFRENKIEIPFPQRVLHTPK